MKIKDFFKNWKLIAIILFVLLVLQTCSRCTSKQNRNFEISQTENIIDSLNDINKTMHDSIIVLNGMIYGYEEKLNSMKNEIANLREIAGRKPIIIYRDSE